MSTWFYIHCLDHTPTLASNDVGQHHYDLPRIRKEIADRDVLVKAAAEHGAVPGDSHFTTNAVQFLCEHQQCSLGLFDEYGRQYALDGDSEDPIPVGTDGR